jgi:hypothetical protein
MFFAQTELESWQAVPLESVEQEALELMVELKKFFRCFCMTFDYKVLRLSGQRQQT